MNPWTIFHLFSVILWSSVGYTHQLMEEQTQSCSSTQYYNENVGKCCDRCPPGMYVTRECSSDTETQCEECRPGSYIESWSYAMKCMRCRPCGLDFVLKVNCSTTNAQVCECQEGYACEYFVAKTCRSCRPVITSPSQMERPTDIRPTVALEDKAPRVPDPYIWILVVIPGTVLALLSVFICTRFSVGKKIANAFRKSRQWPPSNREVAHGGNQAAGYQSSPLLQTPANHPTGAPPYSNGAPLMCIQQPESQMRQSQNGGNHIGRPQEATTHPYQERGGSDKCCTAIGDKDFKIQISYYRQQNAWVLPQPDRNDTHTPMQEEGVDLPYPVEESQQSKCSSLTLNPSSRICTLKSREPLSPFHPSFSNEALS